MDEPRLQFAPPDDSRSLGLQMAPLVDIVFLLICFYLFVSRSIQTQVDPAVLLPQMANPVMAQELPAEIVVNLRDDGRITLEGRTVTLAELRGYLRTQAARAAGQPSALRVVVRADKRQRFAALDQVLAACQGAGFQQVVLRAQEQSP